MASATVTTPPNRWICSHSSWRNEIRSGSLTHRPLSAVSTCPTRARVIFRASAMSLWLGQWQTGWESGAVTPSSPARMFHSASFFGFRAPTVRCSSASRLGGPVVSSWAGSSFGRAAGASGKRTRNSVTKRMISCRVWFTVEQIRSRLESRYPEAERLPDRPELDALLHRVGLDVQWNPETGTFHRREARVLATSGSSIGPRRSTATSARHVEVTPDVAEARQFEERLKHAYADGGFLALTVKPSRMRRCEDELLRRFKLQRVSFDEVLFDALRDEAKELEIDWAVVEKADGADPTSPDWQNLLQLVARVTPKITTDLMSRKAHILLVYPGLLARYDQMAVLETLRDKVGHDVPCPGLWVLVATDGQSEMPVLDHAEIPLITPGQRAKVSESWIDNLHRARPEKAATAVAGKKGGG